MGWEFIQGNAAFARIAVNAGCTFRAGHSTQLHDCRARIQLACANIRIGESV
jgi:hypothetical protein